MVQFAVQYGDVAEVLSDLLLLKFAQDFYGADSVVASQLIRRGLCTEAQLRPPVGGFVIVDTKGAMAPKRVLFLGTPPLHSFSYNEMENFSRRAIEKIADLGLPVRSLTTTVHGTGYGLDGGEALQLLVKGFQAGLERLQLTCLEKITFLTLEKRSERILTTALEAMAISAQGWAVETAALDRERPRASAAETQKPIPATAGSPAARPPASYELPAVNKRRVFVAMPFSEEFENVYEFGIYPAVRNCGLICERVDETHFTGDVLGRIRGCIEAADLVVADLTEGRPNVYLEVGYAWGKGIPVIFVARKGEKLHFDVSTHRCIFYVKFTQFAKDLEELIRGIEATRRT